MNVKQLVLCVIFAIGLCACSFEQLGNTAYEGTAGRECLKKTGGLSCNLDSRTADQKMIVAGPDETSNEALQRQAEQIHRDQEDKAEKKAKGI